MRKLAGSTHPLFGDARLRGVRMGGVILGAGFLCSILGNAATARQGGEHLFWDQDAYRQRLPPTANYLPLSQHLQALSSGTEAPLRRSASLPDTELLLCTQGREKRHALAQFRRLWRDPHWTGRWTTPKPASSTALILTRDRRDERQSLLETQQRLAELSRLAAAGENAWQQLRSQDPDLVNALRQPAFRAKISLASKLSATQVASVMSGQEVSLPFSALTLAEQSHARAAAGTMAFTQRSADGRVVSQFNPQQLDQGRILFKGTGEAAASPGSAGMKMLVYSGPETKGALGAGGELLYPDPFREFAEERAEGRQRTEEARDRDPRTRRRITLDPQEPERAKEPWPVRYLRSWSRQSGYPVCAWWPRDAREGDARENETRLDKGIKNQPTFVALTLLCEKYGCSWVRDGEWIRVRPLNRSPGDRPQKPPAEGVPATKP